MAKKFQKWIVQIEVHNSWIEDGFDIMPDTIANALREAFLRYATSSEVKSKVLIAPERSAIKKLQGF